MGTAKRRKAPGGPFSSFGAGNDGKCKRRTANGKSGHRARPPLPGIGRSLSFAVALKIWMLITWRVRAGSSPAPNRERRERLSARSLDPYPGNADPPVTEQFALVRAGPLSIVRGSVLGDGHVVFIIGGAQFTGHEAIGAGNGSECMRRVINNRILGATSSTPISDLLIVAWRLVGHSFRAAPSAKPTALPEAPPDLVDSSGGRLLFRVG